MTTKIRDSESFSKWYNDSIYEAELVDQSPVRGCVVLRPYGFAIWEFIRDDLDIRIKKNLGAKNAYFPLLIPESFLKKEKEHVEGFSPELAVVTHAGGSKLEEPYVVRPTSETIIYNSFARWIKSYRDLPLKINQWANVIRWEMRTRPFIRTTEFLWQEGHTAHATEVEALDMATAAQREYIQMAENLLAIPSIAGEKTATERFAGAKATLTFEGLMRDGKALQMGTSHLLSHSFPEAFEVSYQDENGKEVVPWCSSWGVTTRLIGALIMAHGDENGLVLPPRVAPVQVVIIPIFKTETERAAVTSLVEKIKSDLESSNIRVEVDNDENKRPGAKYFHWEQKGVPLRLEVGPRDAAKGGAMMALRLEIEGYDRKTFIESENILNSVSKALDDFHDHLLKRAREFLKANTHKAANSVTFEELSSEVNNKLGLHQVGWCGKRECEERLKEAKASARVVVDGALAGRKCFNCTECSVNEILVARSY
jgi:prolyl-tRNA synthetase